MLGNTSNDICWRQDKSDADITALCGHHQARSQHFNDHQAIFNRFFDVYCIYALGPRDGQTDQRGRALLRGVAAAVCVPGQGPARGVELFAVHREIHNTLWLIINNSIEIEFVYPCTEHSPWAPTPPSSPCRAPINQSIADTKLEANPTITLDVWIKVLFIKGDEDSHARESVLNELIGLIRASR